MLTHVVCVDIHPSTTHLTVEAERDEHEEEEERPQLRYRQVGDNFRVSDKGETGACKSTVE